MGAAGEKHGWKKGKDLGTDQWGEGGKEKKIGRPSHWFTKGKEKKRQGQDNGTSRTEYLGENARNVGGGGGGGGSLFNGVNGAEKAERRK